MGQERHALYAGTFDPFTNGHHQILERALKVFDKVTVLIAKSPNKKSLFSAEERFSMLSDLFQNDSRIEIVIWNGLIVDYAKEKNILMMIRGLRPTGDFEIEFQMSSMNHKLFPEIETVFFMTAGKDYFISSTLVREIHGHGGSISDFVPKAIHDWISKNKGK